eukprot:4355677-Pleurochrysis_carterae.AAC.3
MRLIRVSCCLRIHTYVRRCLSGEHVKHQVSLHDKELSSKDARYRALSIRSPTVSRRVSSSRLDSSLSRRQSASRLTPSQIPAQGTSQASAVKRAGSVASMCELSGASRDVAQLRARDGASASISRQASHVLGANGGQQTLSEVSAAAAKLRRELTDVVAAWEESWSVSVARQSVRRTNSQVSAAGAEAVPRLANAASASIPKSPRHVDAQDGGPPASAVAVECAPAVAQASPVAPSVSLPSQSSYRNFQQLEA